MFCVTSVLQTEYLVASVTVEREEIDELAVIDAAMAAEIPERQRAHRE